MTDAPKSAFELAMERLRRKDAEAGIVHEGSGYAITDAKVRVDGKLRCNATITFSLIPPPNPEFRRYMDAVARRIEFPLQALPS